MCWLHHSRLPFSLAFHIRPPNSSAILRRSSGNHPLHDQFPLCRRAEPSTNGGLLRFGREGQPAAWSMPCATSSCCLRAPRSAPHTAVQTVEKDHGRLEARRCYAFDQLACLSKPAQWPDLKSFAVIESERCIRGKTTFERRFYISSLPPDADRLLRAIRAHWRVENSLHWCMDVAFADDQMRARTGHAAHNLAVLKHITLNFIRLAPVQRKGGIKARRLIAATSDLYRAQLLGLA